MSDEEKKRIDEDWKRRAQLEKEQDAAKAGEKAAPGEAPASSRRTRGAPAKADFLMLVESLASQALMFMGAVRDPLTGQSHQDLGQAQAMIDFLEMLEEKTKGNLTREEEASLRQILDEVRMQFVRIATPPAPRGPMMGNRPPGRR